MPKASLLGEDETFLIDIILAVMQRFFLYLRLLFILIINLNEN